VNEDYSIVVGTILYIKVTRISCLDFHVVRIMKDVIELKYIKLNKKHAYSFL